MRPTDPRIVKSKSPPSLVHQDLNTPEAVERFRKAAKAFNARATKSPAIALQVLVSEGIYTKAGRLTKHYR